MYPGYKGQRPPTPEPITEAVKQLRDLIRIMGIPEVIVPGIEADDVIGTVASRAINEGMQVAIASPDKVCHRQISVKPFEVQLGKLACYYLHKDVSLSIAVACNFAASDC